MLRNLKPCGVVSAFDNWAVPRSKGPAIGGANTMNYFVRTDFSMTTEVKFYLSGGGGRGGGLGLSWLRNK